MEIHFCDLCNESVPQSDLDVGRAFIRKGRVVCEVCDRTMTHDEAEASAALAPGAGAATRSTSAQQSGALAAADGAEAPRAAGRAHPESSQPVAGGRGGGGGVLVGMLALVFAAAGFAMMLDRVEAIERDGAQSTNALRRDVDAVRGLHDDLRDQVDAGSVDTDRKLESLGADHRRALEASAADLRKDLRQAAERFDRYGGQLASLQEVLASGERDAEERVRQLSEQLLSMEEDMRFYSDRMIDMEETMRGMSSGRLAGGGVVPAGAAMPGEPLAKAWEGLLPDLQHANAGIRLDAVYALGETSDRDVVPYLIPMLSDVDLFVRMATARVLEDLEAKTAVPALIDALEDPSSAVREAAMVALRHVAGREFRFEPTEPSEAKRAKAVKAWRDWWKKSGDDFLTGS